MSETYINPGEVCVSCSIPLDDGSICQESACKHLYCEFCGLMLGENNEPLKYLNHCIVCDASVKPYRTVTVKFKPEPSPL